METIGIINKRFRIRLPSKAHLRSGRLVGDVGQLDERIARGGRFHWVFGQIEY